jgi:hypothetical protein
VSLVLLIFLIALRIIADWSPMMRRPYRVQPRSVSSMQVTKHRPLADVMGMSK